MGLPVVLTSIPKTQVGSNNFAPQSTSTSSGSTADQRTGLPPRAVATRATTITIKILFMQKKASKTIRATALFTHPKSRMKINCMMSLKI